MPADAAGQRLKIGVIGASGYTGADLIRLAACHPYMDIAALAANTHAGKPLSEVFPHLCERGVPRGADVWEITRLCTAPDHPDPRSVRRELVLGMVEFAVLNGIRRYTCLTHVPYLSSVLAVGWDCEPLGMPQEDGGVVLGAVLIDITPETLAMMRSRRGVSESVLQWEALHAA